MKILMTGATGLIGRQLALRLVTEGHELIVLSRNARTARETLSFPCEVYSWDAQSSEVPGLTGLDAVIHLAGESIAEGRWTPARKKRLLDSRVVSTTCLMQALSRLLGDAPKTIITASAVGFYGNRGDESLDEFSSPGRGFLSEICQKWEEAARAHAPTASRLVTLRIGIVLDRQGGALQKLLPVFKAGVGGPVGGGQQWMSWIHHEDLIGLFIAALNNARYLGPVNAVAPEPVKNVDFGRTLASILAKPALVPAPAIMLKLALGEMAEVVLSGQKVLPKVALEQGFNFKFEHLKDALTDLCGTGDEELVSYQWVPRPIEEVFAFFSKAENLEVITPPFLGFKILTKSTPEIQSGTLIDYRIKVHGIPLTWRTRIENWSPPHQFVDTQLKGPYSKWHHTHSFQALKGGTLMMDRVQFRVPAGTLGQLAAGSFVRGDVESIFEFRRAKIGELFPAR